MKWRAVILAAALGYISWHGDIHGLALLPLLIVIWRSSRTRLESFLALSAYYLIAARCLLPGVAEFWATPDGSPAILKAILYWGLPSILLATCWALAWGKTWISARLFIILVIISFPPIGVVGWASPLTGAGVWFPWMGWYGLGLFIALLTALVASNRTLTTSVVVVSMIASLIANALPSPAPPASWSGINTQFGSARDFSGEFGRLMEVDGHIRTGLRSSKAGGFLLLPEAVGGPWTISRDYLEPTHQAAARRHVTVLIGAQEMDKTGQLVNAVYSIGDKAGHRWVNRVPVPGGLWRPGDPHGAVASWWDSGVQTINGRRIASLICYEQLLVWPVLLSIGAGAEILIAPSNIWFGANTSLPRIEHQTATAWGKLFGVPIVFALNR